MIGDPALYDLLHTLDIPFQYYEHPPAATIDEALRYWKDIDAVFCRNIFFRNHKGNRHYLVIMRHDRLLDIHALEKYVRQGKLSFASEARLQKYLGVKPGSVSPFGLIHDREHHVHLFIDRLLSEAEKLTFHPNDNRATLVISNSNFFRFLKHTGNFWEWIDFFFKDQFAGQ
ncbi:MAG: prolyl-tRNA synthetase associated domain-containing protein [Bacteroidales bacterium]|nr:prolyl-tRNA synthetase associated domain-containing protein [Bacteroidales bacterium]